MKVLFIGDTAQTNYAITKMMHELFPKVTLVEASDKPDISEFLMMGGPFSFIVFAFDNQKFKAAPLYDKIVDIIGMRPFVFIGSPKAGVEQNINEVVSRSSLNFLIETPLVEEEFKIPVGQAIAWVQQEEFEESIQEFERSELHRMKLRNFYLFDQMPFDVYVELTSTKYSKIISKNKPLSGRIIQDYLRKKVKHFYIKNDDNIKFLNSSILNLTKAYQGKNIDRNKLHSLHMQSIFFIQQFIKSLSVTEEVVTLARLTIESLNEKFKLRDHIIVELQKVCSSPQMTFAEQAMGTIFICDAILNQLGWNADMARDKLFLAAILQDIGLQNDELIKFRSLNDPKLKMLPEEDQIQFANHPKYGATIVNLFNGFSEVDFLILEHHEHPTGDGFPYGINASSLTVISCVFIIATNFIARLADNHSDNDKYKKCYDGMKRIYSSRNFKEPLEALGRAIKSRV